MFTDWDVFIFIFIADSTLENSDFGRTDTIKAPINISLIEFIFDSIPEVYANIIIQLNTYPRIHKYLFTLLNAPPINPANAYIPIYIADTALLIIKASPTITPQDEPTLAPPTTADININTVAKTALIEIPNIAVCPTPIMLKVANKLIDITSSVFIAILF